MGLNVYWMSSVLVRTKALLLKEEREGVATVLRGGVVEGLVLTCKLVNREWKSDIRVLSAAALYIRKPFRRKNDRPKFHNQGAQQNRERETKNSSWKNPWLKSTVNCKKGEKNLNAPLRKWRG